MNHLRVAAEFLLSSYFNSDLIFIPLQGAWSGPWVSTEVVAALIGILVYYLAFSAKSTIQA